MCTSLKEYRDTPRGPLRDDDLARKSEIYINIYILSRARRRGRRQTRFLPDVLMSLTFQNYLGLSSAARRSCCRRLPCERAPIYDFFF